MLEFVAFGFVALAMAAPNLILFLVEPEGRASRAPQRARSRPTPALLQAQCRR